MFQAVDLDDYLQIKVESTSLSNPGSSIEQSENLEEHGLTNDDLTVDECIRTTSTEIDADGNTLGANNRLIKFSGLIDIILHPIYQVPCPYVRLHDGNGQPVSEKVILTLTNSQSNKRVNVDESHSSSSGASATVPPPSNFDDGTRHLEIEVDHSKFKFTYEEHPYLQTPCLCLHVCGVGERMGLMDPTAAQVLASKGVTNFVEMKNDCDTNSHRKEGVKGVNSQDSTRNADLYFLNWFMLIAHTIGFQVTASFYQNASDSLCKQTDH